MNDRLPNSHGVGEPNSFELPIDRLVLNKPCGSKVSLHRYAGRWIVLRVAQVLDPGKLLPPHVGGLDAVPLNVIEGPVDVTNGSAATAAPFIFDPELSIRKRFPSLDWPSTFVFDPRGSLVAILSDQARDAFLTDLVRSERSPHGCGTLDRGDIHS